MIFVDDVAEVPKGRPLMLSAHGSAPRSWPRPTPTAAYVVDAVCPLVTKVHHEVKVRARQGLPDRLRRPRGPRGGGWHDGRRPGAIHRVESVDEVDGAARPFDGPVAMLAQTTLSHRDWADVLDATRTGSPSCGYPDAATCASRRRTVSRRARRSRHAATPSWSSARRTRPTPGPSRSSPARPAPSGCCASTAPTSCPTTCSAPSASPPARRRPSSSSRR